MICTNCEDSGYEWESVDACRQCEKGKEIQLQQDEDSLKWHRKEAKRLNKKIKEYQKTNHSLEPSCTCRN